MKKQLASLLTLFTLISVAFGQGVQLELDQNKVGSNLLVDVYISTLAGDDFELGSSSFPFADLSGALDLSSAIIINTEQSEFYPANNAYSSLGVSATGSYVHLMLLAKTNNGVLSGTVVNGAKKKVATLQIPIKNKCGTVGLSWLVNAGTALTTFANDNITSLVNYVGPQAYKLTEELVVPHIERKGDNLYVQVNSADFIWYKDGVAISENNLLLENVTEGSYEVIASSDCEQKVSSAFEVETVTALDESSGESYSLLAYPNPYYGRTNLQYEVKNSSFVKIEVFDLAGNKVATLVNEQQTQGIYNLQFGANENNYDSGTYLVSMEVGDVKLIQKIVELR